MALYYNFAEKEGFHPLHSGKRKYYAVLRSVGCVNERGLAKYVASDTELSVREAETVIELLQKIVVRELLDGKKVKFGELGTFSLTVNSIGCDSVDEVDSDKIKRIKLNFRPGKNMKKAFSSATFLQVEE